MRYGKHIKRSTEVIIAKIEVYRKTTKKNTDWIA